MHRIENTGFQYNFHVNFTNVNQIKFPQQPLRAFFQPTSNKSDRISSRRARDETQERTAIRTDMVFRYTSLTLYKAAYSVEFICGNELQTKSTHSRVTYVSHLEEAVAKRSTTYGASTLLVVDSDLRVMNRVEFLTVAGSCGVISLLRYSCTLSIFMSL